MRAFLALILLPLLGLTCLAQNSNTAKSRRKARNNDNMTIGEMIKKGLIKPSPTPSATPLQRATSPQVVTQWRDVSSKGGQEEGVKWDRIAILGIVTLLITGAIWSYNVNVKKPALERMEHQHKQEEEAKKEQENLTARKREAFIQREQEGTEAKQSTEKLQKVANTFLPLFDYMPAVKFKAMIYKDGFRDPTNCPGFYLERFGYIGIDKLLADERNWTAEMVDEYVKHQLVHAWLVWKKLENAHNTHFNQKAREVGIKEF